MRCLNTLLFVTMLLINVKALALGSTDLKADQLTLPQALNQLKTSNIPEPHRLELQISIAQKYMEREEFELSLRYLLQAEQLASKLEKPLTQAQLIKKQGIIYYFLGNNNKAIKHYQRALAIFQQHPSETMEQANLYSNIGLAYFQMHNLHNALEYYRKARPIFVELGTDEDRADITFNLAGVYIRLARYETAIDMYKAAGDIYKKLDNHYGLAQMNMNIGVAHSELGQYQQAEAYYLDALQKIEPQNNIFALANVEINLANLYLNMGEIEKAEQYTIKAIKNAEIINNKVVELSAYKVQAAIEFARGDLAKAKRSITHTLQLAEQYNDKLKIKEGLLTASLIEAARGEKLAALTLSKQFMLMHKKQMSEQISQGLNEFQAQFESEQLSLEVEKLKQQRVLDDLEAKQRNLMLTMSSGIFILLLITGFALYRRAVEKKSKIELKQKVEQRTRELEKVAQELCTANQVKSQFLANISHEIRTPLTSIIGQADAIINGDVSQEQLQKELQVIYSNSVHLGELINDVLDLSKIEANKLELNYSEVNIANLLQDVSNMFTQTVKQKNIWFKVENELEPHVFTMLDYMRVKQILVNLCSNAVKFTEQGGVKLRVSLVENGILFSVIDTGIGIKKQQQAAIFNNFTQGDNSISRRFGGTGLGLSLSKQLVEAMKGKLSVSSEVGCGSEFSFDLPCELYDEKVDAVSSFIPATSQPVSKLTGTVLLAEDHLDNQRLIARMLRSYGLKVITASSGKQAAELTLQHFPDLVLMDIQMPQMDGLEALQLLRNCGFENPVYALTANALAHEVEHYLESGFNGHLTKPLDKAKFYQTLSQYLNKQGEQSSIDLNVDMSDLIESFKATLPAEAQSLAQAIETKDYKTAKNIAHRLAGAAATFHFEQIAQHAMAIEKQIKAKEYQKLSAHSEAIDTLTNEIQAG